MVGISEEGLRQTLHLCHYLLHIGNCFKFGGDEVLFDVIAWLMERKWSKSQDLDGIIKTYEGESVHREEGEREDKKRYIIKH